MSEVIKSAGLQSALVASSPGKPSQSPRRAAIQLIRQKLRDTATSDDDLDDALEALVELAKD